MAAINTTSRRIILEKIALLVAELTAINARAIEMETALDGLSDDDAADTINKLLTAGGLATTTDGTGDTISDEIVAILYGTINVSVNGTATALSWTHVAL